MLRDVLAAMLRDAGFNDDPVDTIENQADSLLATPQGKALAALVEAALAEPEDRYSDYRCWHCGIEVKGYPHEDWCVVRAYRETTK